MFPSHMAVNTIEKSLCHYSMTARGLPIIFFGPPLFFLSDNLAAVHSTVKERKAQERRSIMDFMTIAVAAVCIVIIIGGSIASYRH